MENYQFKTEDYGFIRVAAASPRVHLADTKANAQEIISLIKKAEEDEVALVTFPELSITGYCCGDLFGQKTLLKGAMAALLEIAQATSELKTTAIVGLPVEHKNKLYNCAAIVHGGEVLGLVPKTYLPNYNEFYEARWFSSAADFKGCTDPFKGLPGHICPIGPNHLLKISDAVIGIELCEDLWTPIPPSSTLALMGANLIVNLSASNEVLCKHSYRKSLVEQQSARCICGYVYASSGYGESTQDLVYAGASMIAENGAILAENERFQCKSSMIVADIDVEKLSTLRRKSNTFTSTLNNIEAWWTSRIEDSTTTDFEKRLFRQLVRTPFVPGGDKTDERCKEIIAIQVAGLRTRLEHIGCRTAVIGISGGLDSTLALLVTVLAFDSLGWSRDRIVGVTMPGYGTTDRTRSNAEMLMDCLGVTSRKISITKACDQHFSDIGHDKEVHDVTYENSQARERTQILMDIANQTGGIVVGTGDLSELALGWATYNGDHMSMYAVNASVPKTLVRHLVRWASENHFSLCQDILSDIIDTPISPELLPADSKGNILQVTEDLVGPYELHDFFLYNFFRFGYSPKKLLFLAKKTFCSEETITQESSKVYDEETVRKWLKTFLRRFFNQQFKRSCLPDGPKVGSVTLSPRGDWRMPSDAISRLWLEVL